MLVSSDYDMKEQMSRNFPRALGPFSDPVLVVTLESNTTGAINSNMTFLWIDPTGQLAEVSEMHIEFGHMVCKIVFSSFAFTVNSRMLVKFNVPSLCRWAM